MLDLRTLQLVQEVPWLEHVINVVIDCRECKVGNLKLISRCIQYSTVQDPLSYHGDKSCVQLYDVANVQGELTARHGPRESNLDTFEDVDEEDDK